MHNTHAPIDNTLKVLYDEYDIQTVRDPLSRKGMNMDVRMLQYFLTIAREKNITRAAESLHMAQPPLSRQLQQLEDELGVTLFTRSRKGMELTDEGKLLQERALRILELMDKTRQEISDAAGGVSGTVYIGASETIVVTSIPSILSGFHKLYPEVTYQIRGGNSDDVIARLEQGLLDFAIIREPYNHEDLQGMRLWQEAWCVLLPSDDPLAKRPGDTVTIRDLADRELIVPSIASRRKEIESWFTDEGLTAHIFCEYAPLISSVHLVRQQVGCAILPESVSNILTENDTVTLKRIISPLVSSYVTVLTRKYHTLSKTAEIFLSYLKEECQKEV